MDTALSYGERLLFLDRRLRTALDDIGGLDGLATRLYHVVNRGLIEIDEFDRIVRRFEDIAKWKPEERQVHQNAALDI